MDDPIHWWRKKPSGALQFAASGSPVRKALRARVYPFAFAFCIVSFLILWLRPYSQPGSLLALHLITAQFTKFVLSGAKSPFSFKPSLGIVDYSHYSLYQRKPIEWFAFSAKWIKPFEQKTTEIPVLRRLGQAQLRTPSMLKRWSVQRSLYQMGLFKVTERGVSDVSLYAVYGRRI